ncbi:uncharacterized protein EV420DRAFT_1480899 [Desarmillaria tabescens]|uniref:Uncharacterized protein n=1 Tax=Armillaria tabescens TaxID=1929756 RepID=A0AA39N4D6_ARMTA|nr:uncharacterized protein EV420DRAFT_1480899 [Desarmillaria tabescens]KAK0457023.1 hypothetical protein EV420DRAFT_1480899 [Desarmillaria tabescens]
MPPDASFPTNPQQESPVRKRSMLPDAGEEEDEGQSSKRMKVIEAPLTPIGKPSRLRGIGSSNARQRSRPRAYANARRPTVALNPSTPLQVIPPESSYKLGSFDFWPITHNLLVRAAGSGSQPNYEAIFDVLSTWQSQGIMDRGIRCFIPDLPNAQNPNETGWMQCFDMRDPVSGETHKLAITSLTLTDAFKCDIRNFPQHRGGEVVESAVGNASIPVTGIVSASGGVFKVNCSPVWTAVHDNRDNSALGIELCEVFEGHLEMSVMYDSAVAGSGNRYEFRSGLWGIRMRHQG